MVDKTPQRLVVLAVVAALWLLLRVVPVISCVKQSPVAIGAVAVAKRFRRPFNGGRPSA